MMRSVTSLVSGGNLSVPVALVDGVMVFNLILRGDWLMAEIARFHIAIPSNVAPRSHLVVLQAACEQERFMRI